MRTVKSVELRTVDIPGGSRDWWHIIHDDTTRPGLYAMIIPADSMHWRAAEYSIDPADAALLLDIVTHEHLAPVHSDHPNFLYNTTATRARAHYLAGIEAVRDTHGLADPDNLLEQIRQHHTATVDLDEHDNKTDRVRQTRAARMEALRCG